MSIIKRIPPEDFDDWVSLYLNAFPGEHRIRSAEDWQQSKDVLLQLEQEPTATFYGLYRQDTLVGGMCIHDYMMNFHSVRTPVGGVGHVSVHLAHKKEHIAKELITFHLQRCREQGQVLALLHPFRPDFYRPMGYGYGPKMSQYRFRPSVLPKGPSKAHVRLLGSADRQAVVDCHTRTTRRTHGMIELTEWDIRWLIWPGLKIAGYECDGQIQGYVTFTFEEGEHSLYADMHVWSLLAETPQALSELLTFLHSQADQIRTITTETLDDTFHHLLSDPRRAGRPLIPPAYHESNLQGVGLMYRVTDIPRCLELLQERDFGGQTCHLTLTVADSFLPENATSLNLEFKSGRLTLGADGGAEVELRMDVGEFSSMLAGAVPFRKLYSYGLAELSDPADVDAVDRLFAVRDKPICLAHF